MAGETPKFVPLPKAVGEKQALQGDFTQARYFRMRSAGELEYLIGYRSGRLRDGWWLMFLTELPDVTQFEFRGYSHLSGGREQGHLPSHANGPTTEDRLRAAGANLTGTSYMKQGLKQQTIAQTFTLSGFSRLAKVRPVAPAHADADKPDYPPGAGIPQWTLTAPLKWVAAAFIAPGGMYEGNYE